MSNEHSMVKRLYLLRAQSEGITLNDATETLRSLLGEPLNGDFLSGTESIGQASNAALDEKLLKRLA